MQFLRIKLIFLRKLIVDYISKRKAGIYWKNGKLVPLKTEKNDPWKTVQTVPRKTEEIDHLKTLQIAPPRRSLKSCLFAGLKKI